MLKTSDDKNRSGKLSDGFTYIGYYIEGKKFSVKNDSISKLELGLENIFVGLKHNNYKKEFFAWKLNIRITGCINNKKKYGWLFYFSQINDKKLLYHLDWLVEKLFERFDLIDLYNKYSIKKFVRTLSEIINNLHQTEYIPNFDDFSIQDKLSFLSDIVGIDMEGVSELDIISKFNQKISSSINDLEKDMQDFS
ncbi:MAG: hypothetical protein JJE17_03765 [Peptostreptococcaceae bacterium]|nr:hypothetical protein [Peptostreptococcaceae bacterium]